MRLKLVGSGEDQSTLRGLAQRLNFDDHIDWVDQIFDPHAEYFDCDIIAHPSRWEGCSYALLEAAAARRAIIASSAGGNPEVIGEAGVLLPARDTGAWSDAICVMAFDEARRKHLGDAALARVQKHFRIETMVDKTIAAYGELL